MVDVTFSKHPGYNTYDVLSQFEEIYTKHKDSEFFKQFHDSIEYMFIRTAFFTFLYYMYRNTYKENKKAFKISVEKAANSVEKYAPNWRKNIYLNEKDTMDSPYI
ncbi:MAG: hypothetical protein HUJ68_01490 [Clostridia bacterium]|nr:hypothetical protein [Clostridia bacterium]